MRLDSLPDDVMASVEIRNSWRRRVADRGEGLEFLVSDLARWRVGSAVRVAFLDGDSQLHGDVAGACMQITDACNLELDFGFDSSTGESRRWNERDTNYAADIRVSFDLDGYFSLVGTDSTDRTIAPDSSPVGGRPGQRSLNLGGFPTDRPDDWEGIVRHEFLHALAFHHSHQNMRGPCETEFRWEDDDAYVPTQNANGMFIADPNGRRPGIYTFLAGAPNHWPRQKVDFNLRTEEDPELVTGPFDPDSVMLYSFPPFFYKSNPSRCAPTGNGIDLSNGDKRALALLYPHGAAELSSLQSKALTALDAIGAGAEAGPVSENSTAGAYRARVIELLTTYAKQRG